MKINESTDTDLATLRECPGCTYHTIHVWGCRQCHHILVVRYGDLAVELARLRQERDWKAEERDGERQAKLAWKQCAEATERELARLREGLREIISMRYSDKSEWVLDRIAHIARDLLAEDGAA